MIIFPDTGLNRTPAGSAHSGLFGRSADSASCEGRQRIGAGVAAGPTPIFDGMHIGRTGCLETISAHAVDADEERIVLGLPGECPGCEQYVATDERKTANHAALMSGHFASITNVEPRQQEPK